MTTSTVPAPSAVRLTGQLDPHLSRWLWLVKMFLAFPHYVVLGVLWIAFVLVTVVAGVCILFTGRYPRRLFDFNAGVLRWNWRVGFYVYAALGTDRYPPFTLARADYPAEIEVAYPARLSRGLVLVKWLLAVPHLIIVGLIVSDVVLYPWSAGSAAHAAFQPASGYSIINLLVVAAGVFLLITGKYPGSLFSFVMGVNRWLYRVLVYVALLSDEYPPFRFDGGAHEPGCEGDSVDS
ncbi:MAG: hypothetical protein QOH69_2721 [Actinomycetota bacterium]|nr:hypothetical protein [Actinomycetota bacterium]